MLDTILDFSTFKSITVWEGNKSCAVILWVVSQIIVARCTTLTLLHVPSHRSWTHVKCTCTSRGGLRNDLALHLLISRLLAACRCHKAWRVQHLLYGYSYICKDFYSVLMLPELPVKCQTTLKCQEGGSKHDSYDTNESRRHHEIFLQTDSPVVEHVSPQHY